MISVSSLAKLRVQLRLPILSRLRTWLAIPPGFHRQMTIAGAIVLTVCFLGCYLTSVQIQDAAGISVALALAIAAVLPLPLYWNEKGKTALRDAALTIPWALFYAIFLPYTVAVAGRARLGIGLRDAYFAHLDASLGVSVPAILAWAQHHWLGHLADSTYVLLIPMLPVAYLLPALAGKVRHAQQFITSNLIAFAIGLPIFALLPAVGPWYGYRLSGYRLPANPAQALCQASLQDLRTPGPYVFHAAGVVCFPSFHVIWALVCANALWAFKPLRIPVAIFAGLIILSTLTTAWHYFVDVLAGVVVAAASIAAARFLSRNTAL